MNYHPEDIDLDDELDPTDEDFQSKTQIKQELKEITAFGVDLSELSIKNLKKLPLTESIIDAYGDLERIKGNEARKRHFKRIGKLLREVELEPIKLAFERYKRGLPLMEPKESEAEKWFDRLINKNENAELFIEQYPQCDRQQLRQLIRNTLKSPKKSKPKLLTYLDAVINT
ncbi:ribosome biogenesis factor YjgA [Pleionea sediminis]|uniref:ribosome biogenesis factor YjgA n=1 Tax=Pleionea sediminis TaxID=2569479 RepID=UPI001185592B|nr:ribosome biogenesis factor YjgA [Pleionea sediminis]